MGWKVRHCPNCDCPRPTARRGYKGDYIEGHEITHMLEGKKDSAVSEDEEDTESANLVFWLLVAFLFTSVVGYFMFNL
jgi:hypothetical protein